MKCKDRPVVPNFLFLQKSGYSHHDSLVLHFDLLPFLLPPSSVW